MEKVNALKLRQGLGRVLKKLENGGQPVYVERNRHPVAVLISIQDFRERFADRKAQAERQALIDEIHRFRHAQQPAAPAVLDILKELRGSK